MGDHLPAIAKARGELEELYSGIPDDSVNLTFQDLAEVRPQNAQSEKKKSPHMNPIAEANPGKEVVSPLTKLPSLDFNRALGATSRSDHPIHYQNHHLNQNHHLSHAHYVNDHRSSSLNHHLHHGGLDHQGAAGLHGHRLHGMDHHARPFSHRGDHHAAGGFGHGTGNSMAYDDMSGMTMASMGGFSEIGGRRRPGIPHSNICTVCSTYIYIFRHRCLVCGRVYCRQCLGIGMGQMTEGRKCIECLGRRFSQRYIQKAGQIGCCMGYPSMVKQQELMWAEKGPRRSGENRHCRSGMPPLSRSPTPTRPQTPKHNSNSFVMSSPYSPYYSPTNHPLPF